MVDKTQECDFDFDLGSAVELTNGNKKGLVTDPSNRFGGETAPSPNSPSRLTDE